MSPKKKQFTTGTKGPKAGSQPKVSLKNKEFLKVAKGKKKGDKVEVDKGEARLELVGDFNEPTVYEERISDTVVIRKEFGAGKLFKKEGSNALVFIPEDKLQDIK